MYVARTEDPKCNETNTNANTVEILWDREPTHTHTNMFLNEFGEKFKLNEIVGRKVKCFLYADLIEAEQQFATTFP